MAERVIPALARAWRELDFEPFRPGVEIHHVVRGEGDGPAVALLRYAPGGRVPRHRHAGVETILVLDGVQSDEHGDYPAGTFVVNPVGSEHSVWSRTGCVVLIQWDRPVVISEEGEEEP